MEQLMVMLYRPLLNPLYQVIRVQGMSGLPEFARGNCAYGDVLSLFAIWE